MQDTRVEGEMTRSFSAVPDSTRRERVEGECRSAQPVGEARNTQSTRQGEK
jgi:hypothetical protein